MEFPYKAAVEEFLENALRAQGNSLVKVTIADDGKTATVQIADKYTQYRLSPQGQERIRTGVEGSLVGDERFLLPMDEPEGSEEITNVKTTTNLEARVMKRLQEMKSGQTIKELADYLGESEGKILVVLAPYVKEGHVTQSDSGWVLVHR